MICHGGDKPLSGIRIIDISTSYAGPYCSMLLADMGAEVIKIEKPITGDDCRSWGPPFVNGESAWFLSVNRGKKSMALDFRHPEGRAILEKLLAVSDVFIENLKPSSLSKYGLTFDAVQRINPKLVYCSISGFGLTGPYADVPGYDLIAQATSGLMSVTGEKGGRPQRVGTAVSDIVTGIIAAFCVVNGLIARESTGRGTLIDTALLDTDVAMMAPRIVSYLVSGEEPAPSGGTDSVITVYQSIRTADRDIVVATGTNGIWKRFCQVIEREDLAEDPRFISNEKRKENHGELIRIVENIMMTRPAAYWLERFRTANVPAAPIQFLAEVVAHPQVKARKMIQSVDHPVAGRVPLVTVPWWWNGTKPEPKAPPLLGEHSREIAAGLLELSESEIEELESKGILQSLRKEES